MANLSITFSGELELRRSTTTCGGTDSPTVYRPRIRTENSSSSGPDAGNKLLPLTSAGPHTLAWPTGLLAVGFYIGSLDENGPEVSLSISRQSGGPEVTTVRGMYFHEYPSANRVTAVSVTGTGSFEWCAW